MKLFQLLPLVSVVHGVFTPANRDALKIAVGTCIENMNFDNGGEYYYTCTGGCLGENTNGACPIFAASNDATGYPYGPIGTWDVSKVTDMSSLFTHADAFDQNLSSWDVSKVTNMNRMFYGADAFDQDLSSWDVSQVTDMQGMFHGADAFDQDIGNWDVSSVTIMQWMFMHADAFDQDIGNWDVSSVTNMEKMFYGADAFNQCLSAWNVDKVQSSSNMFEFSGLQRVNYPCSSKWTALKTKFGHPTEVRDDSCSLCNQTGHYALYDSTECIKCPVGYFQMHSYQNYCSACAWGKWSDVTGAASNDDCIDMETVVANRVASIACDTCVASIACDTLRNEYQGRCGCTTG